MYNIFSLEMCITKCMKTIAIDVTANSTKYIIKRKEMPIPREIYQLSQLPEYTVHHSQLHEFHDATLKKKLIVLAE